MLIKLPLAVITGFVFLAVVTTLAGFARGGTGGQWSTERLCAGGLCPRQHPGRRRPLRYAVLCQQPLEIKGGSVVLGC